MSLELHLNQFHRNQRLINFYQKNLRKISWSCKISNFKIKFRKYSSDIGIQLVQAASMPYDRLFNFQELVKKMEKCAEKGDLRNLETCRKLKTKYLAVIIIC